MIATTVSSGGQIGSIAELDRYLREHASLPLGRETGAMRRDIVEGNDYSILPPFIVHLFNRLRGRQPEDGAERSTDEARDEDSSSDA